MKNFTFIFTISLTVFFIPLIVTKYVQAATPTPLTGCRLMDPVGDHCNTPYFQCDVPYGADFCCATEEDAHRYNGHGLNCRNYTTNPTPTIPGPTSPPNIYTLGCGETVLSVDVENQYDDVVCDCKTNEGDGRLIDMGGVPNRFCCGWYYDGSCQSKPLDRINNPVKGPDNETFNALNPLKIGGANDIADKAESEYAGELSTPGGIVSRVIKFLFPLAGLVLFVMLVWGGFEIMMGSISKKVDAGKQRVTAAIVGFLILFATYWIWQIIQVVFGVKVL